MRGREGGFRGVLCGEGAVDERRVVNPGARGGQGDDKDETVPEAAVGDGAVRAEYATFGDETHRLESQKHIKREKRF